jgi:hypothetical protein
MPQIGEARRRGSVTDCLMPRAPTNYVTFVLAVYMHILVQAIGGPSRLFAKKSVTDDKRVKQKGQIPGVGKARVCHWFRQLPLRLRRQQKKRISVGSCGLATGTEGLMSLKPLKFLLGVLTGLAVVSSMMCFVFGPKGILYLVIAMIAYSAGQLFLKVFRP